MMNACSAFLWKIFSKLAVKDCTSVLRSPVKKKEAVLGMWESVEGSGRKQWLASCAAAHYLLELSATLFLRGNQTPARQTVTRGIVLPTQVIPLLKFKVMSPFLTGFVDFCFSPGKKDFGNLVWNFHWGTAQPVFFSRKLLTLLWPWGFCKTKFQMPPF